MSNFKTVNPGTAPMAADIDQFRLVMTGQADMGAINLANVTTSPVAPTLALGAVGVVTLAVKYQLVSVTGWKDSAVNYYMSGFVAGAESTITPSNQIVNVTIPAFTAPVIGIAIYRTAGAGATGTEKFVGFFTNPVGGTFADNMLDATRGTGMPASTGSAAMPASVPTLNTTGTTLAIGGSYLTPKPWIIPTMLGAWVNYGAYPQYPRASYYKDDFGIVHLAGMVKSGAGTIFTLPAGCRPSGYTPFACVGADLFSEVVVGSDGAVAQMTGSNTWVSLHNIHLRAEV